MEDASYVSLSLEKYNELYDKAKAYDEMQVEEAAENSKELLKDIPTALKRAFGSKEETAATTEEVVEEIEVGDLVEIVKDMGGHRPKLNIGKQYTIKAIDPGDKKYKYNLNNEYNNWACDEEIKLVKKGEVINYGIRL